MERWIDGEMDISVTRIVVIFHNVYFNVLHKVRKKLVFLQASVDLFLSLAESTSTVTSPVMVTGQE